MVRMGHIWLQGSLFSSHSIEFQLVRLISDAELMLGKVTRPFWRLIFCFLRSSSSRTSTDLYTKSWSPHVLCFSFILAAMYSGFPVLASGHRGCRGLGIAWADGLLIQRSFKCPTGCVEVVPVTSNLRIFREEVVERDSQLGLENDSQSILEIARYLRLGLR